MYDSDETVRTDRSIDKMLAACTALQPARAGRRSREMMGELLEAVHDEVLDPCHHAALLLCGVCLPGGLPGVAVVAVVVVVVEAAAVAG